MGREVPGGTDHLGLILRVERAERLGGGGEQREAVGARLLCCGRGQVEKAAALFGAHWLEQVGAALEAAMGMIALTLESGGNPPWPAAMNIAVMPP